MAHNPPSQWVAITDGVTDLSISGGGIPIAPIQGTFTDRSGTITLGGTAQTLAAANTSRHYLIVVNDDTSETLWINFTTAAVTSQPSIPIQPRGSYVLENSVISTELVSVIAATTSHAWTAKEM